jgi:C-terminal processing protease CtpA/Prc
MKTVWLIFFFLISNIVVNAQSLEDKLSTEDKIYGLSKIWSEVTNNFVFLDRLEFDFDSLYKATIMDVINAKDNFEYINILRKFMSKLDDGHTGVMYSQFYWNGGDYPPVFLKLENDKFLVRSIKKEYAENIPIGSELLKADGVPYAEYKKISPSGNLFSYLKTTVLLEFRTPSGELVEKAFIRNFNHMYRQKKPIEMVSEKKQSSNDEWKAYRYYKDDEYAIVEINTFSKDTIVKQFQNDISKINESKGLIIDVRKNGGGDSRNSKGVAQHLVQRNILVGPLWKTRINNAAKKAWGSMAYYGKDDDWTVKHENYWKNNAWEVNPPDTTHISEDIEKIKVPIVILMGEETFSAAEDFLIYTLGNSNITKIGQNSAGSSGQPLVFSLPGGISARVCAKRDALPNGEDYIGLGIEPDIKIEELEDPVKVAKSVFYKKR